MIDKTKARLGDTLISLKLITAEQLHTALTKQKSSPGKRIGQILLEEGFITQQDLIDVLKTQFGVESVDLRSIVLKTEVVKLIPENLARRHNAVPIKLECNVLTIAMSDPLDRPALSDIAMITGKQTEAVLAPIEDVKYAIESVFSQSKATKAAEDYAHIQSMGIEAIDESNLDINSAPIVRLVTSLIETGVRMGASDIHIEPDVTRMRVRMRVDGILQEVFSTSNKPHNAVVSRIKIMSNLNISERRLPQDGRILTKVDGRDIDLRVAIMPSTQGEKVVIRILDKENLVIGIEKLGLYGESLRRFKNICSKPHGMIFVTGPTGSGKTTTLYTMLMEMNNSQRNILTIEDPVEYDIEGVAQTQVNTKAGLTFAVGLRGFMRSDPDIIMVGEVRDEETADVAVNSALTGHLVLSTLHTNDAVGAVARLVEMQLKPYIIASSLSGVIAQRLVRKICNKCKTPYQADNIMKEILKQPLDKELILYKGTGCDCCNKTGYKGRTGIFEVLEVNKNIRQLITENANSDVLFNQACKDGMVTLQQEGIAKVLNGITTVEELLRVAR